MAYLITSAIALIVLMMYFLLYRPWQLSWGATADEVGRSMPGDDFITNPSFNATRSVTIHTTPENIWPWLIQIGCKRAGWYSYDWVDNLGIPSSHYIVPELQQIEVGQFIPMIPNRKMGFFVIDFEFNCWILWTDKKKTCSWLWGLYPLDSKHTRLITRVHFRYRWLSPTIVFSIFLDIGDILMMRKCMLGIKQRAERLARGEN